MLGTRRLWHPSDLPGLQLFVWRGRGVTVDGSNNVTQWRDLSSYRHLFTQRSGTAVPTYPSGRVLFTAASAQSLACNDAVLVSPGSHTIAIKWQFASTGTNRTPMRLFCGNDTASRWQFQTGSATQPSICFNAEIGSATVPRVGIGQFAHDTDPHRIVITYDGVDPTATGSYTALYDGSAGETIFTSSTVVSVASIADSTIGCATQPSTQLFDGYIDAIVACRGVLSARNRARLDEWLAAA